MKHLLAILLLVMATPLWGQSGNYAAVSGKLYVLVHEKAKIFLNGAPLDLSKADAAADGTAEVTFHPGDRLVAKVSCASTYQHLVLLFVSDDKQTEISFKASYFKILPDFEATDFTQEQFNSFPKMAIRIERLMTRDMVAKVERKNSFLYKNYSEYFWGDRKECALGTVITSDMFSPLEP